MRFKLIAAAAASLAVATPALANDFVVQYKDLDLSNAKDRQILERRIDNASRVYCGADVSTTGSRVKGPGSKACVADARRLAREQLAAIASKQQQVAAK